MHFKRLNSTEQWRGPHSAAYVDQFLYEDGTVVDREIIRRPAAVVVLAIDENNDLFFVRQPREAVDEEALLELPAGKIDENEEPLRAAQRELAEEVGLTAAQWRSLGSFYSSPGFTDETMHAFVATDLSADLSAKADADERIEVEKVPMSKVDELLGECRDAKTLLTLMTWLRTKQSPARGSALVRADIGLRPGTARPSAGTLLVRRIVGAVVFVAAIIALTVFYEAIGINPAAGFVYSLLAVGVFACLVDAARHRGIARPPKE